MPLLSVKGLEVDFASRGKVNNAVRGISFDIAQGDVLALVGESGSGKSVTAASIIGLLPRKAVSRGSIRFENQELIGQGEVTLNAVRGGGIGMIFQNPLTSLDPSFRIGAQLEETARHHKKLDGAAARKEALDWLGQVGIRDPERVLKSYPHQLSGGMRQRVMIALAAMGRPKLLIADEPTTALDSTIQKQILDLLRDINARYNTAILMITHDFGVVSYLSNRVAVMQNGEIVEQGPTSSILSAPRHAYTERLLRSVPRLGDKKRNAWAAEAGELAAARPAVAERRVLLEVRGLSKTFQLKQGFLARRTRDVHAVRSVDIEVGAGEIVGIIGESGSGKSTLARLVARLIDPTEGSIRFDGEDVAGLVGERLRAFRRRLQFVFQDATSSLNPRRSIGDQLSAPILRLGAAANRREALAIAAETLARVGLSRNALDRFPHEFSGGQRQRIGIARALAVRPEFVILDEPTSALDVSLQAQLLDLLLDLRRQFNLTYVFVGHNLPVIEYFCDRIAVMEAGSLIETLDAGDIVANATHSSTRKLIDAVLMAKERAAV